MSENSEEKVEDSDELSNDRSEPNKTKNLQQMQTKTVPPQSIEIKPPFRFEVVPLPSTETKPQPQIKIPKSLII